MADYRKMWEDLGMDVETHDQLCEVLPQAFGDVYLSQENRPESMDYYNFVVAEIHGVRPAELIEHQKKGGDRVRSRCHRHRAVRRLPVLGAGRREGPSHQHMPPYQGVCGRKAGSDLPLLPHRGYVCG